jgi:hypothetical protein
LVIFAGGPPRPVPKGADHTGEAVSIDFDGDLASFAILVAQLSGLNVVVEAGSAGRVRIAGRDVPWDAMLKHALRTNGLGYKLEKTFLRIARQDRVAAIRTLSGRAASGPPVNLSLRHGDLRGVERLFEELLEAPIDLPPGPYDPLTIVVQWIPADEALDLIFASRGWGLKAEGKTLRAEPAR